MKQTDILRPYLIFLLLSIGIHGTAQVVLTDDNSSPQPGDVYPRTTGQYLDPVPSGGGIPTYDYSELSSTGSSEDTLRFTSPSDTMPYSGLVPGADAELFFWGTSPDGEVLYYSGTNAGLDVIGDRDDGTYVMSDPKTILVYPCTAGSSWADTYYGQDAFFGAGKGGMITVNSSTVCNVVTPSGLFSNVLRLEINDSFDYIEPQFILHRERSIIEYRKPGIHHPVMYCIQSTGYDEFGNPIPGLYGEWCEWLHGDLSTSIRPTLPAASAWSLVQNPVEDLLGVSGFLDPSTSVYHIRTADGRLVREGAAGDLRYGVKVDDLSGGIYVLQCGGAAVRFIKE